MITRRTFITTGWTLAALNGSGSTHSPLREKLRLLTQTEGLALGWVADNQISATGFDGLNRLLKLECCGAWSGVIDQRGQRISGIAMRKPMDDPSFVVLNQCGGVERSLPTPLVWALTSLSPDGRSFAMRGRHRTTGEVGFFLGNFVKPNDYLKILQANSGSDPRFATLSWSPTGDRMVFNNHDDIYVYDLGAGALRKIATGYCPTWSPDGSLIAFRSASGTVAAISPSGRAMDLLNGRKITNCVHWCPSAHLVMIGERGLGAWLRGLGNLADTELRVIDLETNEELVVERPLMGGDDWNYGWFRLKCLEDRARRKIPTNRL